MQQIACAASHLKGNTTSVYPRPSREPHTMVCKSPMEEGKKTAAVHAGFAEILPEKVTLLAEIAEWSDEIDLKRAEAALERAKEFLRAVCNDCECPAAVMGSEPLDIFEQESPRPLCPQNCLDVEKQCSPRVSKAKSLAGDAERLARESSQQDVMVGNILRCYAVKVSRRNLPHTSCELPCPILTRTRCGIRLPQNRV